MKIKYSASSLQKPSTHDESREEEHEYDEYEYDSIRLQEFRKRMDWLRANKDKDGLYTLHEIEDDGNYTGVEINEN